MKNVFACLTLLIMAVTNAQSNGVQSTQEFSRDAKTGLTLLNSSNAQNMGAFYYKNPPRRVDGSAHLWDTWDNHAIIFTVDDVKFSIRNINLNVERNVFESEIIGEEGKLYAFNFNNIKKFVVNNRVFRNYYYNDDNRVYEIIYENDEFSLMKGFKVNLVEGSANPMLNRSADRYVKKESYFVKSGDKIKPIKLKKNKILKLVDGDEEKAANLEAYVKANNLSYKKEYDVQQILEFSAKN